MKVETVNLIASYTTLPIWLIVYAISSDAATGNDAVLSLTGLIIFILWGINILGSVLGLISIIKDWTSLRAWFATGIHFLQFAATFFVTFLGFFLHFE